MTPGVVRRSHHAQVRALGAGHECGERRVLPPEVRLKTKRIANAPRRAQPGEPEQRRVTHIGARTVERGGRDGGVERRRANESGALVRAQPAHHHRLARPRVEAVARHLTRGVKEVARDGAHTVGARDDPVGNPAVVTEAHGARIGVADRRNLRAVLGELRGAGDRARRWRARWWRDHRVENTRGGVVYELVAHRLASRGNGDAVEPSGCRIAMEKGRVASQPADCAHVPPLRIEPHFGTGGQQSDVLRADLLQGVGAGQGGS